MSTLSHILAQLHRLQPELAKRHVARIGVFGSVARGHETPNSDIDVLVELTSDGDLFDLAGIKHLLQSEFAQRVDVVAAGGLKPDTREAILREVRYAA